MANFPTWQEWQLLSEDERKVYGDNYNAWVAEKENEGVLKSYGGTEVAKPYERTWAKDVRPQLVVEGILPRTDISETLSAGRMGPVIEADVDTRLLPAATAETISAPVASPLVQAGQDALGRYEASYEEGGGLPIRDITSDRATKKLRGVGQIPRYEAELWSGVNEALQSAIPASGRYGTKKATMEQLTPGLDVASVAPAIMPFNPAIQSLSGEERQWRRGRQEEELLRGLLG